MRGLSEQLIRQHMLTPSFTPIEQSPPR
jgi:hypothetical protein